MKKRQELSGLFREMGLTGLEATVYIWLLEHRRSTGYKIAMKIGKPVANTYKALKSLEQKGAVISDHTSSPAFYDTIPVEQFLNKIENEFESRRKKIINEVARLDLKQEVAGIYELQSAELVFEKAYQMIASAGHSLVIDSFPQPLRKISEHIIDRRSDNIQIFLKHYGDEQIEGIRQIRKTESDIVLEELQGQWLIIVKDAVETLIAFFDRAGGELLHSVWIQDAFLSLIQFSGSLIECTLSEILEKVYGEEENKIDKIKEIVRSYQSIYSYFNIAEKNISRRNEQ